jgi:hypothetical protein
VVILPPAKPLEAQELTLSAHLASAALPVSARSRAGPEEK